LTERRENLNSYSRRSQHRIPKEVNSDMAVKKKVAKKKVAKKVAKKKVAKKKK
jgi:hypothetical protein